MRSSLTAVSCTGTLSDSSALRGHPQAPAFLEQLKQPFDETAGSAASKVRSVWFFYDQSISTRILLTIKCSKT